MQFWVIIDFLKCHLMKHNKILETWILLKVFTGREGREAMERCSEFYRALEMKFCS